MGEPVDTSAEAVERHYGKRDLLALGERFANHMYAMTAERLVSKGDIAAELAWRDWQIECRQDAMDRLQSTLTAAQQRISDLEAQCARVQRDADRYAWLRELREDDSISVLHWSAVESDDDEAAEERAGAPLHYDELDAAIDAAMAAKADDWLTREARQIGLHSPACASFGQNECDCGAAMAPKGAE